MDSEQLIREMQIKAACDTTTHLTEMAKITVPTSPVTGDGLGLQGHKLQTAQALGNTPVSE